MGLNGFTQWLFSALLSWMQIIYNWFWSMLASGGQNEFMPWFSDNWMKIVIALLIIGVVVDYTTYLMRWQPYHIWLTALRRARGYVSRPFEKEPSKLHYAGYRRVLEDGGDEAVRPTRQQAPRTATPNAKRPASTAQSAKTYEATSASVRPSRSNQPSRRQSQNPNAPRAQQYAARTDSAQYAAQKANYQYCSAQPQADYPAAPRYVDAPIQPQMAVDADEYIPESVAAPDRAQFMRPAEIPAPQINVATPELAPAQPQIFDEMPTLGEPPRFVNSDSDAMPVYGRAFQKPGQAYLGFGMAANETDGGEMKVVEPPVFDDWLPGNDIGVAQQSTHEKETRPQSARQPAPAQDIMPAQKPPVRSASEVKHKSAPVQRDISPHYINQDAAADAPRQRSLSGTNSSEIFEYTRRQRSPQRQQERPTEARPQYSPQRAQPAPEPVSDRRRPIPQYVEERPASYAQAQSPAQYPTAQPTAQYETSRTQGQPPRPRSISVQKAGSTRDMEFDDDID